MADAEPSAMKLQVLQIRRGPCKGRFGWVLYNDDVLVQSRKTWPTQAEAQFDAAEFVDEPAKAKH